MDENVFKVIGTVDEVPPIPALNVAKQAVMAEINKLRYNYTQWLKFECPSYEFAQNLRSRVQGQLARNRSDRMQFVINVEYPEVYLWIKRI